MANIPNFSTPPEPVYVDTTLTVHNERTLMMRVYSLLSIMLGVTFVGYQEGLAHMAWVNSHPWAMIFAFFMTFILVPTTEYFISPLLSMFMALLFSFVSGFFLSPSILQYTQSHAGMMAVNEALAGTACIFIGLSIYSLLSKRNFHFLHSFLITGLIMGLVGYILNDLWFHMSLLQSVIAGAMSLVFSGLILMDTQRIKENGANSAVMIVTGLYLDIINLFLSLLQILDN